MESLSKKNWLLDDPLEVLAILSFFLWPNLQKLNHNYHMNDTSLANNVIRQILNTESSLKYQILSFLNFEIIILSPILTVLFSSFYSLWLRMELRILGVQSDRTVSRPPCHPTPTQTPTISQTFHLLPSGKHWLHLVIDESVGIEKKWLKSCQYTYWKEKKCMPVCKLFN